MIAGLTEQGNRVEKRFDNVDGMLSHHTREIERIEKRIEDTERRLAGKVDSMIEERLAGLQSIGGEARPVSKKDRESDDYWHARRSLRFAPIRGSDLRAAVAEFVKSNLDSDSGVVEELPQSSFRKVPNARNASIKDEVTVTFKCSRDRDYYKSQAFRLAGKKECSIRLELPNHMLGQHRLLSQAGQELRSKNQGCRTSIKFEDDGMRLVLDYRLQNGAWRRLCPDKAAEVLSSRGGAGILETTSEDFRELISRGGVATGGNAQELGS
jgi:hypothetical protein